MVAQPQTGIATPEGNGDTMKEVPGTDRSARRGIGNHCSCSIRISGNHTTQVSLTIDAEGSTGPDFVQEGLNFMPVVPF